jgi:hypothetical protein
MIQVGETRYTVPNRYEHAPHCVFWLDDESDEAAYGPEGCCTCHVYERENYLKTVEMFATVLFKDRRRNEYPPRPAGWNQGTPRGHRG